MSTQHTARVLVAGIGGASLGTEIVKCLLQAGRYEVLGCDISPLAYGHFQAGVEETFIVNRQRYARDLLELCRTQNVRAVIPGGEEPLHLLTQSAAAFRQQGVLLATNNPTITNLCGDKARLFARLSQLSCRIPWTTSIHTEQDLTKLDETGQHEAGLDKPRGEKTGFPCVVKPATQSGGSHLVFLAETPSERDLYIRCILNHSLVAVVQEYIPLDDGEFTIGVLSTPCGRTVQATVLQRIFHSRLSTITRLTAGVISSGFSQGLIDHFPELSRQAIQIAELLGSTGPLNIQARRQGDTLVPFEINPRFSASTFLRTLSGFNEIDAFLGAALWHEHPHGSPLTPGYYLRSFDQAYAPRGVAS